MQMKVVVVHQMCCQNCLQQYCKIQVKEEEDIVPWLACPAPECAEFIPLSDR
eukprot:UN12072